MMFGKAITTGKLLVTYAAAFTDPTLISGGAATLETLGAVWQGLGKQDPELTTLAKELTAQVKRALDANQIGKESRPRFETMLQDAAPHMHFVKTALTPELILKAIREGLTSAAYDEADVITLTRILSAPLEKLCNDPRLSHALAPALHRHDQHIQQEQLLGINQLKAMFEAGNPMPRDALLELARHFNIENAKDLTEAALHNRLVERAEELQSLKNELAQLRAKYPRLDNMVAEALAHLEGEKVDTAAARALVKSARQTLKDGMLRDALEQNAELAEIEARTYLIENDPDTASEILSAAADSFAPLGPLELSYKRNAFAILLYNHGLRYSGSALARAADMWEKAAAEAEDKNTLHWAKCQQNLAAALRNLATRSAGEDGTTLLNRAIAAYEDALMITTKEDHPLKWAQTQQNLAIALKNLATRSAGEDSTTLLNHAITAYEDALTILTIEDHPLNWATTQQNLAIALETLATRSAGEDSTTLLKSAITAYEDALSITTKEDHPLDWATTQENLAMLHFDWHGHPSCADPRAHLEQSLPHVNAALTVYDETHTPYYFEKTTRLRDKILTALSG